MMNVLACILMLIAFASGSLAMAGIDMLHEDAMNRARFEVYIDMPIAVLSEINV